MNLLTDLLLCLVVEKVYHKSDPLRKWWVGGKRTKGCELVNEDGAAMDTAGVGR